MGLAHQLVNNQTYGKDPKGPVIKFEDLNLDEEFDISFLTAEQKQILLDVKKQAVLMSKEDLENWIVLPYFELMKWQHLVQKQ